LKNKLSNFFVESKNFLKKIIFLRKFIIFLKIWYYTPKLLVKKENLINNKTILITGSNSGIGLQLTKKLLEQNNCVIAFYNKNSNNLNKLNFEKLIKIKCDLSSLSNLDLIKKKLKKLQPEIIINNAAYVNNIDNLDLDRINEKLFFKNFINSFNVNFFSILKLLFIYFDNIKKNKIKMIINISSDAAIISKNKSSNGMMYKTTKTAVNAITRCLHLSLAKYNVNLFALHPGPVKTKLNYHGLIDPKLCASKIVELMSKNNKFFNGKFININESVLKF
jgi:NAD(P)-dependent dehydrogenase (short-subunit alcohol dehydrogenase family)